VSRATVERLVVRGQHNSSLQESLAPLGVTETGQTPYRDHPHAAELTAALAAGKAKLDSIVKTSGTATANGWRLSLHSFDFNLDFFEVGALDDPNFKISDPQTRIVERAVVAMAGLWGNHAYEAAYAVTYTDSNGDQLTGKHTYTLRLDPTPPVGAFWSLTMYNVPDYFLVANDISRYSIDDRTPGIVYDDDRSLTITISATRPTDASALANWLPAPDDDFRPVLRMYAPAPAILDQTYEIPPIIRDA
jgi:hypothetical protein